jgi:hypothetical protein
MVMVLDKVVNYIIYGKGIVYCLNYDDILYVNIAKEDEQSKEKKGLVREFFKNLVLYCHSKEYDNIFIVGIHPNNISQSEQKDLKYLLDNMDYFLFCDIEGEIEIGSVLLATKNINKVIDKGVYEPYNDSIVINRDHDAIELSILVKNNSKEQALILNFLKIYNFNIEEYNNDRN